MVTSRFGHSLIATDDFCTEGELLKAHWERVSSDIDNITKDDLNNFYDRLDKATASGPYITPKCVRMKQELLIIYNLLKSKLKLLPICTLSNGEAVTEEMLNAGYDSVRDQNGTPPKGWMIGHAAQVYSAMREVAPPNKKFVKIPETADEAEAMLRAGYAWLKGNAPERLLPESQAAPMPDPKDVTAYAQNQKHTLTQEDQALLDKALMASMTVDYEFEPPTRTLTELKLLIRKAARNIAEAPTLPPVIEIERIIFMIVLARIIGSGVEDKIKYWSVRPAPSSKAGVAWEDGARQGYAWALNEINWPLDGITKEVVGT